MKVEGNNPHAGHRQRMRQRYIQEKGIASFKEHEILEMLMFYTMPRRDTNALAHSILEKYGSGEVLFNTPPERLIQDRVVSENTAVLIGLIQDISRAYVKTPGYGMGINSKKDAENILKPLFFDKRIEGFCVLFLDDKRNVVSLKLFEGGKADHIDIDMNSLLELVDVRKPDYIIVAHNHPSETYAPSENDMSTTYALREALLARKVRLIDHIIVCGEHFYSFAQNNLCKLNYY